MFVLPESSSGSTRERCKSSETRGKLCFRFGKKFALKLIASVIEEWEQNLNQEHARVFRQFARARPLSLTFASSAHLASQ